MSLSMRWLIAEFDKQWDHGLVPDVGKFVAAYNPLSSSQLTHLLLIDQSRRWAGGDKVSADDYFKQFPELLNNAEAAIDLLFAEFLLREESEATLSIDDFSSRYPQFADELRRQVDFHRTVGTELLHDDSNAAADGETSHTGLVQKNEVPGYEILGELGRGGLGVVYLARDLQLNRKVALKMLLAGKFASINLLKRLLLEAEATARLQHPNIVQIYEISQHDNHPFLALEYISGGTLAQWMERRPQSPRDSANIIREVALAIQFAHENGVIHRDLKPSNLLIQALPHARTTVGGIDSGEFFSGRMVAARLSYSELQLKIADFGLAKFVEEDAAATRRPTTLTGDLMGTAAYMSPEQAQGGRGRVGSAEVTASTDIYSLGAILYELLTGRPPFMGYQPLEVLSQVIADEPIRPSQLVRHIPKDLQTICLKCLEKSPARRYASAAALADDLQRFLSNQPIVARHTMMIERGWRWCRRNPVKTTLTALVASVLLMVASLSSVYSIMLGNQLAITTKSERTEKSLKLQALDQLWQSSLSQADALRASRQVGQRFESLKAIDTARALGNSIQFEPSQIDRMRNATIAALALPDMRSERQWKRPWPDSAAPLSIDDSQTVFAHLLESSVAVVGRVQDGMELARFENVKPGSKLVLSPDGKKLAIFKDRCRVYSLDMASPELLFDSTSSGPWAFGCDGTQLIGTDGEGQLKLVEIKSPQAIKTIGNFRGQQQVMISPDSQRAAIWIDNSIQVVEIESGKVTVRVATSHQFQWQCFVWHPNSRFLAIAGDQDERIELWDVMSSQRIMKFPIIASGQMAFCFDLVGDRLLVYNYWNKNLQMFGASSGEEELSQKGHSIVWLSADSRGGFSILQSLDSEQVASVKIDCSTVYQTLSTIRKDSVKLGLADMAYSGDGRFLAYSKSGMIEVFHTLAMTSLAQVVSPRCYVRFDSDGSLVTLDELGIKEPGLIERGLNRWRLHESSDGDSESICSFGPPEPIYRSLTDFANAPFEIGREGKLIAAGMDNGVLMWSTEQARAVRTQSSHRDVRRVSISFDEKRVASAGWSSGNVCIWDAETGQLLHTIFEPAACTVQFSPNGKLLATNASDITVRETVSWKELFKVQVNGQPNSGVVVCFSPDSKTLAVSDSQGRIHLIDSQSGREFLLLTGLTEKHVSSMQFRPDGKQLAVEPGGESVHFWNLDAIQAELDARDLGWQTNAGMSPLFTNTATFKSNSVNEAGSPTPPKVSFIIDERFQQLEAIQCIAEAGLASTKFDFDAARVAIARAVALKPKDPPACNNLAWLLATGPAQLRDLEKALELAQFAVQECSEEQRSLFANTLGVAHYRTGKFEDALAMLKQSFEKQTPESQSFDLYFLSMCSCRLGEQAAARDFFDRAETLSDQFRSKRSFDQQAELDEFSREAKTLLNEVNL